MVEVGLSGRKAQLRALAICDKADRLSRTRKMRHFSTSAVRILHLGKQLRLFECDDYRASSEKSIGTQRPSLAAR